MIRYALVLLLLLVSFGTVAAQNWSVMPDRLKREIFLRACEDGDAETVRALLANGVSAKAKDRFGQPAIIRAVRRTSVVDYDKTVSVLKLLLDAGADINGANSYGTTPLFLTRSANPLVSKPHQFLLDSGARKDVRDKYGLTLEERPYFYSRVKLDPAEIAWRLLIEGDLAAIDERIKMLPRDPGSSTFLMAAAYYDMPLDNLLKFSTQSDVDTCGDTFLFYLGGSRDPGLIGSAGFDRSILNKKNSSGETALSRAAKFNNDSLILRFLRLGADPDIVDDAGRSALFYAAEYDYWLTTLALLPVADPNMADSDGTTPMIAAAKAGNLRSLMALVNAKLSVPKLNAEASGGGKDRDALLKTAASLQRIDPDRRDRFGRTALIYAALNGRSDLAEQLLRINASVGLKDNYGKTALDYARRSGNKAIVQVLTRPQIKK
jgi:ankyrin repeat protein